MRNRLSFALILSLLLLGAVVTLRSTRICENLSSLMSTDVKADAWVNELPGPQGERQTQAVWCQGSGWDIQPGCCYGGEDCTMRRCRKGPSFSCDGNHWY